LVVESVTTTNSFFIGLLEIRKFFQMFVSANALKFSVSAATCIVISVPPYVKGFQFIDYFMFYYIYFVIKLVSVFRHSRYIHKIWVL
jgi:hypothetical protein